MNKYQKFLLTSIIFIIFSCALNKKPELYHPGNLSEYEFELNTTFTQDCHTLYFTKVIDYYRSHFMIYATQFSEGKWSVPVKLPFNGRYSNYNPFITPDGKRLFFTSNRPSRPGELKNDNDLWYVDKTVSGWSEPVRLSDNINTSFNQFGPSMDKYGNLYYSTMTPDTFGLHDIYYSRKTGNDYSKAVNLGKNINSSDNDYDPAVSWDGKIIVFCRGGDLFVSYKKSNDWTRAVKLGPSINTCATEFKPFITFDKKYLYYTSTIHGNGHIYRITLKDAGIKSN